MKKILVISGMALVLFTTAATQNVYAGKIKAPITVSVKAQNALSVYFPEADNVKWVQRNQTLTAYFTNPENRGVAQFDKKGRLVCTVLYHHDNDLPMNITINLKKEYKDYSVENVVEYTDSNNHYYFVLLEGQSQFVRVKIADIGDPVVVEQLKKA